MVSCENCRNEFRVKNFLFQHENPRTFVQFQFGLQKLYLPWRIFWALYHIVIIIYIGVRVDVWAGEDESQYVKWFIYLTNWAYFILTVTTIVDCSMVLYVFVERQDIRSEKYFTSHMLTATVTWVGKSSVGEGSITQWGKVYTEESAGIADSLPWYMRATWCIWNMGNVISVTMSLAYWTLVFDGDAMTATNILTHIVNTFYVLLNLCVTGVPKRILHFWPSILVGVIYSLFTLFYHLAGGTNHNENPYVYPVLDWQEPGSAILYCVIVCLVAVPVVHVILYGIHCLKMLAYNKCKCCMDSSERDNATTVEMKNQYPY